MRLAKITPEMIDQAAAMAGVGPFTAEQKKMMLDGLKEQRGSYEPIRALKLANSVPPAFVFHPLPAEKPEAEVATKNCAESKAQIQEIGSTSADFTVFQMRLHTSKTLHLHQFANWASCWKIARLHLSHSRRCTSTA